MGASYQLLPIVLGRPIWSERLARWQFWILLVSLSGMVAHFYLGTRPGLVLAAALLAFGVTLHLINGLASLGDFDRWTFTARLIVLAYAGLALTVAFGLALGVDRLWPFLPGAFFPTLHAHVHLALLGFLMPMVLGVAARVYPMFLLAPEPAGRSAQVQLWGLALGAPAVVLGLALGFRVGRDGRRRRRRRRRRRPPRLGGQDGAESTTPSARLGAALRAHGSGLRGAGHAPRPRIGLRPDLGPSTRAGVRGRSSSAAGSRSPSPA